MKQKEGYYLIPTNVALKLYNSGIELQYIASFATDMLYFISDTELKTVKDFEGKKFYSGGQGSSPDVVARYLFTHFKTTPDFNYSSSPEIARFMIGGKYHYAILPQPLAQFVMDKTERELYSLNVSDLWREIFPESIGIPQLSFVYVGKEQNKVITRELMEMVEKYTGIMLEDSSATAESIKEFLGYKFPATTVEKSLKPIHILTGKSAKTELNLYIEVLMSVTPEAIGGKVPSEEFFTN